MTLVRMPVSAQRKIVKVNTKLGNPGIRKQQGTTRILYDSLPVDGRTVYRFFENANNRAFPFTNMAGDARLKVGESMSILFAYLTVLTFDAVNPDQLVQSASPNVAGLVPFQWADLNFSIANSQVIKPINVSSFTNQFNKNAYNAQYSIFQFDTELVIPSLIEFVAELRTTPQPAVANTFLALTFEGVGAILSPRTTF